MMGASFILPISSTAMPSETLMEPQSEGVGSELCSLFSAGTLCSRASPVGLETNQGSPPLGMVRALRMGGNCSSPPTFSATQSDTLMGGSEEVIQKEVPSSELFPLAPTELSRAGLGHQDFGKKIKAALHRGWRRPIGEEQAPHLSLSPTTLPETP